MTIKEHLLLNFEKCIFGLIWTDDTLGERKSYFTLMPEIAGTHTNKFTDDTWQLYDVTTEQWVRIKWAQFTKILWETTNIDPNNINKINVTDEFVASQKDFQTLVAKTVSEEKPNVNEKYKDHSDEDLCTEVLCSTGKQLHPLTHKREKLLHLLDDIERNKIFHVIDYTAVMSDLLKSIGVSVPTELKYDTDGMIGRDNIRDTLNNITDSTSIALIWDTWQKIIQLHIKQHVKDLEDELIATEYAEEIEEINVAIELVKEALDGTDANQFKNVGDVCHFWPPLLYPPPCFVL